MKIENILNEVSNGSKLQINFKNKKCILDGTEITVDTAEKQPIESVLKEIERLYSIYYVSEPTPYDRKYTYFKAKSFEEMTDLEMVNSAIRKNAMAELELYVFQQIISNNLIWIWNNKTKFWQSEIYKSLIILKEWI